ncbi:MAG: nitronate monooxygenase, partial [Pseudohongiellaceae bacterium]
EVVDIESKPGQTQFEDIQALVQGAKGRELFDTGDLDKGIWSAGMIVGLIDDIPTCRELIARIVSEAEEIINERLVKAVS